MALGENRNKDEKNSYTEPSIHSQYLCAKQYNSEGTKGLILKVFEGVENTKDMGRGMGETFLS